MARPVCAAHDGAAWRGHRSPGARRGRRWRYSGGGGASDGTRAPTAERLPAGHGGGGDSSPELLVDGKGKETGSAAAFSDEARAPVAGGSPASGWREREVGSTLHGRKSGKRGLGLRSPWTSSRWRRRPDSDGGVLGQRRSASDTDESAVETGARKARQWCGASTWQPRGDGALIGGLGAGKRQLIGGPLMSVISILKIPPNENSSKNI
jgi:hypothetical protein